MPLYDRDWIRQLAKQLLRKSNRRGRRAPTVFARPLRVMRLEERRVLNADAAAVQQLFVDAGSAANDGHADTFHVQQTDSEIHVSLNGREISRVASEDVDSIEIRGSSDDDILIAEFDRSAARTSLNLRVDGNAGRDILTLVGGARAERIVYELGSAGSGRVQVETPAGVASVTFDGVEAVDDQITAGHREFRTASGEHSVTLDDSGSKQDNRSRLEARQADSSVTDSATSIVFRNPLQSLAVDTRSSAADARDAVEIRGLDERFDADLRVDGSNHDSLSITGRVHLDRGNVSVATGQIHVMHDVTSRAAAIRLDATHAISVDDAAAIRNQLGTATLVAANIEVDGRIDAHGGHVSLDSGETGTTVVRGRIDVSDRDANHAGGSVHVLGATVIVDGAVIDATGAAAGGAVLVGGDYQGRNPAVRNADYTFVGPGTVISADALANGSGGKVVVWANEITEFYGRVTARGGSAAGHGGFAEVSGREHLVYRGNADLSAAAGGTGTLLLDPAAITIRGGNRPGGGVTGFKGDVTNVPGSIRIADATPTDVYETEIEFQSVTAHIVLEASRNITTAGDFIDDAVTLAPNSNLTLRTSNSGAADSGGIDLGSSLDGDNLLFRTQGTGTITIVAGTHGGGTGDIRVARLQSDAGDISITTNNGDVSVLNKIASNADVRFTVLGNTELEIGGEVEAQSLVIGAPGDFNGDAVVDANDYNVWRSTFGSTTDLRADANADGVVDAGDYVVWRNANGGSIGLVRLQENVTTTGAPGVVITAGQIFLNGLTIDVGGAGDARFNGPTVLEDATTVQTAGGRITFANTLNSLAGENNTLTLAAGAGIITFEDPVGGTTPLGLVTIQSAGQVDVDAAFRAIGLLATAGVFDAQAAPIDTSGPGGGPGGDVSITTTGLLRLAALTTGNAQALLSSGVSIQLVLPINAGAGDVRIVTPADLTQLGAGGTITAGGLALNVGGTTTLNLVSNVARLAADNGGTLLYRDSSGLAVSDVTVFGTTVAGIKTTGDDVKLIVGDAAGEDLAINRPIALGGGDLMLNVAGSVTQAPAGTITAAGLALMVNFPTTLDQPNNVATLAAANFGTTIYNDVDSFDVGQVTVLDAALAMTVTGFATGNADAKLIAGDDLAILQPATLNRGDLLLDVAGNVTQSGPGIITASGLALIVDGTTTLDLANVVGSLAANNGGTLHYREARVQLGIGTVVVDGMPVTGITTTNDDVKLIAAGDVNITQAVNLGAGNLLLDAGGNVAQTAPGTITAAGLALMVDGTTTLSLMNNIATLSANDGGTILYNDVDSLSVGQVTVLGMTVAGITTSSDDVKLIVGDAAGENLAINRPIALGAGDLLLDVAGNVTQSTLGIITASGLGLMVDGITTLGLANNVATLAANNGGTLLYNDVDGFAVGDVTVIGMTVSGIGTTNDDVKLIAGGNLVIGRPIVVGAANLLVDVAGNVSQATPGTITATGLALMVDGTTTLELGNSVVTFAAHNGGTTLFSDIDGFTIGSVSALGMTVTGLKTAGDDVKLIAGGNLAVNQAIDMALGNLFLDVSGNVAQSDPGTITAAGLALMVDGMTTLDLTNNVAKLAADSGGTIRFVDGNGFSVDEIGVLGMTITGIRTSDDDVKLTAGGNVTINRIITLGDGDLLLDVAGDVAQVPPGAIITAAGLALMVDGSTTLGLANNVAMLAADNGGTIVYRDSDGLMVGQVTVLDMTIAGIETTDDDVKLIVGDAAGENLTINQAVAIGDGDLMLTVAGNVGQATAGTIVAGGLALVVGGNTTLDLMNNVHALAADTGGTILYRDIDALTVSEVTALDMTVTGIKTTGDDVKLIVGENLTIHQAIALGTGNLLLDITGHVTQSIGGTIAASGLALMVDGKTLLREANNVTNLAALNGDRIFYNDVDSLTVTSVTSLGMTVTGIQTSGDDAKLIAGGNLSIVRPIALVGGNLLLDAAGNVSQAAPGTIMANGLALMVDGVTTLDLANNVSKFAVDNFDASALDKGGSVLFMDADGFDVDTVIVFERPGGVLPPDELATDEMVAAGITTTDDDVKLIAGGNLAIRQEIDLGTQAPVQDGSLLLDVAGNVTQTSAGTIKATGLALMVDGTTTLDQRDDVVADNNNDVDFLAANNGGTIHYIDRDGLVVGAVTSRGMTVSGIATSNDDVKLVAGGDLSITRAIALGAGDLLLVASGNLAQSASGTITAAGLGLMIDGNTVLDLANDVDIFAADNGGTILFNDPDEYTVGEVTVFGMTISGISSDDEDVKLIAGAGITIDRPINLGTGSLMLVAGGNVTQVASGTITAAGLGLMVEGDTLLELDNDVELLAGDNTLPPTPSFGGQIQFHDANDVTIGTVTVFENEAGFEMTVRGARSAASDVLIDAEQKLTVLNVADLDSDVSGNDVKLTATTIVLEGPTIVANDRSDDDSGLIEFDGAVELAAATFVIAHALPKDAENKLGGIKFASTLKTTPGQSSRVDLTATNGTLDFMEAVGTGTDPIGEITIHSAFKVVAHQTIDTLRLKQVRGLQNDFGSGVQNSTTHLRAHVNAELGVELDVTPAAGAMLSDWGTIILGQNPAPMSVNTNATPILLHGHVMLNEAVTALLDTTQSGTTPTGANIEIVGSLNGAAIGASTASETIQINAGATGVVRINSHDAGRPETGDTVPLNVTILDSNKTDWFQKADLLHVIIDRTGESVIFHGSTDIVSIDMYDDVMKESRLNNIGFRGPENTITMPVVFSSYGIVTLGNGPDAMAPGQDSIVFLGGVSTLGPDDSMTRPSLTKLFANLATSSGSARFGPTVLSGNSSVETESQSILFAGTLDGDADLPVPLRNSRALELESGEANIDFRGAIGAGQMLGDLTIEFANNVTAEQTIHARSLKQVAGFDPNPVSYDHNLLTAGVTQLKGNVLAPMGVTLKTEHIILHGADDDHPLLVEAPLGNVRLESHDRFNLDLGHRPIDLKDVQIVASKGKISDAVLAASLKAPSLSGDPRAFGALDRSRLDLEVKPIQGAQGPARVLVEVTDPDGMSFEVTFDWREGTPADPDNPVDFPNSDARYVKGTLPAPPGPQVNFGAFDHLFTTTPDADDVSPGSDIPVFISITEFAQGSIELFTASADLLVQPDGILVNPDGSPNGIQVIIPAEVTPTPPTNSVPSPAPIPAPPPPAPIAIAIAETPAPPFVSTPFAPQSSAGVQSQAETRYYELRIVTPDADGRDQRYTVNLSGDESGDGSDSEDGTDSIYPFHPGKLRELFRRLPDDHYRIYLIEDGTERLILDFTIQQGRPVETLEELPSADPENTPPVPTEMDSPPDDGASPPIPLTPAVSVAPPTAEERPFDAHPYDLGRADGQPDTAFARRLGIAEFVVQGGIVLTAATLSPASCARREAIADHLMASFGRMRPSAPSQWPASGEPSQLPRSSPVRLPSSLEPK